MIYAVNLVCYNEENVPNTCGTIFVKSDKDIKSLPVYILKELLEEEIKNKECESIGTIFEISDEEFYEEYNVKLIQL